MLSLLLWNFETSSKHNNKWYFRLKYGLKTEVLHPPGSTQLGFELILPDHDSSFHVTETVDACSNHSTILMAQWARASLGMKCAAYDLVSMSWCQHLPTFFSLWNTTGAFRSVPLGFYSENEIFWGTMLAPSRSPGLLFGSMGHYLAVILWRLSESEKHLTRS